MLLKRMKEVNVGEENRIVNIHEIDLAEVPKFPSKPRVLLNLLVSVFMGLFLAGGVIFFMEYTDDTVKTQDDLKRYFNLPYLGPVPNFGNQEENIPYPELVLDNDPKSQASEAYRAIRTAILFSSPDRSPRTLLITSAGEKEGKTITTINIGAAMAQAGQKVLILDCDMRKPRINKIFNDKNERGLSNILVGEGDWDKSIQSTPIKNLEYIPSGPIPPNPSELLGSDRMRALIQDVTQGYDRVLMDCSPLGAVTDPVVLSRFVEGVVLVIKAGNTSRDLLTTMLARLKDVQARILGAVLNDIKVGRDGYYYHSYYGDDGEKKKRNKEARSSNQEKLDTRF
jgi:capsular exopolysaccharide synthesis family protein